MIKNNHISHECGDKHSSQCDVHDPGLSQIIIPETMQGINQFFLSLTQWKPPCLPVFVHNEF